MKRVAITTGTSLGQPSDGGVSICAYSQARTGSRQKGPRKYAKSGEDWFEGCLMLLSLKLSLFCESNEKGGFMMANQVRVQRNDWIRFQLPDKQVLEGFVQQISPDETKIMVGRGPGWPENQWHSLANIRILVKQTLGTAT
jgi:hypothetical protein